MPNVPFIDLPWASQARCRGLDPEMFFPVRGEATAATKATCDACPVRGQCLEYALDAPERLGVWGGLSERQRRPLRAARRNRKIRTHAS